MKYQALVLMGLLVTSYASASHLSVEADDFAGKGVAGATVAIKCARSAPNLPIVRAGVTDAQGLFDAGVLPDNETCSLSIISIASKQALLNKEIKVPAVDSVAIEPLFDTIE